MKAKITKRAVDALCAKDEGGDRVGCRLRGFVLVGKEDARPTSSGTGSARLGNAATWTHDR